MVVRGEFNKFLDFFFMYRHLKLSLTLENLSCYGYTSYVMTDLFLLISGLNEQLQQELECTLLTPDCHSW